MKLSETEIDRLSAVSPDGMQAIDGQGIARLQHTLA
jgi:hypothetical protein